MTEPYARETDEIERLLSAVGDLDGIGLLDRLLNGPLANRTALVSSFGAESIVLLDMVATVDAETPVIFLQTGKLFPETLDYHDMVVDRLGLKNVQVVRPDASDLSRHDPKGELWRGDLDLCCHIRKTEPLNQALEGYDAWINGRKRYQGGFRAALPTVERDVATGRIRINPLAHWSLDDIRHYRRLRHLPLHPLVSRGFSSIGCAPCTRPASHDGSLRTGRWPGLDKSECGIHLPPSPELGVPRPAAVQGIKSVDPVVDLDSRARCASAASFSANR